MPLKNIIIELNNLSSEELTSDNLKKIKRKYCKDNKISRIPTNIQILWEYRKMLKSSEIQKNEYIENILRKRSIRSESWIVPIQVLTKPFHCPWQCIFCPNDATMPKSYINTEPWAMRALLNNFDPIKQVYNRLLSLHLTWHNTDKIEMIVLWWTWDVYPNDYKLNFIKWLFDACNTFQQYNETINATWDHPKSMKLETIKTDNIEYPETIQESQKINEIAKSKIIWLTVETRPEYVTDRNCKFWRELWITRIEMWIQSLFDEVLEMNKRWHNVDAIKKAMHKMRQYWFKFSTHFMPWLYGSDIEKDIETMKIAYNDINLKPDEIKFYPTSVIPNTELYELFLKWEYKPLNDEDIEKITVELETNIIPPYSRVKRLIRDIPETEIMAWSKITNLRQIVENKLFKKYNESDKKFISDHYSRLYSNMKVFENIQDFLNNNKNPDLYSIEIEDINTYIIWKVPNFDKNRNFVSLCTRSREIRNKTDEEKSEFNTVNIIVRKYLSSVWQEFFLSFEDELWYLYWFVRLLLPDNEKTVERDWLWKNVALVREVHIYWQLAKLNCDLNISEKTEQHKWFWTKLMKIAELISSSFQYKKISVISWIWVRWFYEKIWYNLEWTYMVKELI